MFGGNPSLAAAIGFHGNSFEDYVAAFSVEHRRSGKQPDTSIVYIRISTTESVQQTSSAQPKSRDETPNISDFPNGGPHNAPVIPYLPRDDSKNGPGSNPKDTARSPADEEFFEILKVGIRLSDPVLDNILDIHLPMVLGPVGSPVGALAGVILSAAGKFTTHSSSPVHNFRQGLPYDGIVERAILGEAAFSVVMSMKRRNLEKLGIFSSMAKIVKEIAPATKQIAPYIMHILTAPALRIALHGLQQKAGISERTVGFAISARTPFAERFTPSSDTLDWETEIFLQRLSAHCITPNGSQDYSSGIDRILQIGFHKAGPVLTSVGLKGLGYLSSVLPAHASGYNGTPSHHPFIEGLPERGMLGEAALQALIKVPKEQLDDSAFDTMAKSVARIGQVVLEISHGLVEDVGFAVKGILAVQAESYDGDTFNSNGFESSLSRREKGVSFLNLEREVLDYYRRLETKV